MGDRIFSQHRIPKDLVTNHLSKIYIGSLYSIAAKDEEFLNEYLEKRFSETTIKSINSLQQKGYVVFYFFIIE